jgi:DNA ligase (NAD+)
MMSYKGANMDKNKLEKLIEEAQEAYYNGDPFLTDTEYDRILEELSAIDPMHPLITKVGAPPHLKKVRHRIPMGSQSKVHTSEEFLHWANKTKESRFVAQEKIDGASVEFIYKSGRLVQAISRGDGFLGEDVTSTVLLIPRISQAEMPWSGSLRGEVVISKKKFERYLKDDGYANPRNAAAGILRRKIPKHAEQLSVYFFDALRDPPLATELQKMLLIKDLGFFPAPFIYSSLEGIERWYQSYQDCLRATLPYDIDGLVVKVNSTQRQQDLGEQDNRPKGQIAWKFAASLQESILEGIEWDLGLTGRITPVALLKPVAIGGTTVTRASLHNVSNIQKLGAWVGATVVVSKRGDIIPQVDKVLNPKKISEKFVVQCPVCATPAKSDGEFLVCPNSACPAKVKGDLLKWIRILGIDLAGDHFVDAVADAGLVTDPSGLYRLTQKDLLRLDRFGSKSADKVLKNIQQSKSLDLPQFLAGLNIQGISIATFEAIQNAGYHTIDQILNLTLDQLILISGIGEITAKIILNGLAKKKPIIKLLLKEGIKIKEKGQGKLIGQSFCFTGQISITRSAAQQLVKNLDGDIKSSVSKGLTYLVQANATSKSTKTKKAQAYGTKVIGEEEFFQIVDFSFNKLKKMT